MTNEEKIDIAIEAFLRILRDQETDSFVKEIAHSALSQMGYMCAQQGGSTAHNYRVEYTPDVSGVVGLSQGRCRISGPEELDRKIIHRWTRTCTVCGQTDIITVDPNK